MTRPLLHESTVFDGRPNRHLSDPPANWQPLLPRFSFNPMYLPAIPLTPDPALALAVAHPVGPKKKRSRADSPNEVDLLLGGQLPGDSFRGLAWIGDAVLLVTLRERLLRLAPQSGSLNQVNVSRTLAHDRCFCTALNAEHRQESGIKPHPLPPRSMVFPPATDRSPRFSHVSSSRCRLV